MVLGKMREIAVSIFLPYYLWCFYLF
jgi:hypothetical protein